MQPIYITGKRPTPLVIDQSPLSVEKDKCLMVERWLIHKPWRNKANMKTQVKETKEKNKTFHSNTVYVHSKPATKE